MDYKLVTFSDLVGIWHKEGMKSADMLTLNTSLISFSHELFLKMYDRIKNIRS